MSAPLILTADELRDLASGLDALSKVRRDFKVGPSSYSPGVTIHAAADDITLSITWRDDLGYGQYVIEDRYGS